MKKDILHEIVRGMCPHISVGVPKNYWVLAKRLTQEVYGQSGTRLLDEHHEVFDDGDQVLHSLGKWDETTNTRSGPEQLIEKLEKLKKKPNRAASKPRAKQPFSRRKS